MNAFQKDHYTLEDCMELVRFLRSPEGCPWDQAQTHQSIRRNFIEEAYETADAIDRDDAANLCEELADVLLQVLFHTDIEERAGRFTITDVCDSLCGKMIYRHPHLFSDAPEMDWDELKRREKGQQSYTEVLRAIPQALPALWRADKLLAKAEKAGLHFEHTEAAVAAASALPAPDSADAIGDALLALTAAARAQGIDPEDALNAAISRGIDRFAELESEGRLSGSPDVLWNN